MKRAVSGEVSKSALLLVPPLSPCSQPRENGRCLNLYGGRRQTAQVTEELWRQSRQTGWRAPLVVRCDA